jgi:hypothetical protein
MFRRFYGTTKRNGESGLMSAIWRGFRGLFRRGDHQTKMETAVRHAFTTGMGTLLASIRHRYMSRSDERGMFASWDTIYRRIHQQKLECGAIERINVDTTELHRANIIPTLVREHTTARTITSA